MLKFTKGHNYVQITGGVTFPFSTHCLKMLYICTKFQENISKGFKVIKRCGYILKVTKGHNSVNTLGGIMLLFLSILSDNALYLYQVL